jgi:2-succinyl-6-hydroxy-2,4-cyclohexadiene-1-carboxylate synthase
VPLHVEQRGSGAGPPVILLHGFTQTARLWGSFGDDLARDHTLIGIDLPGHAGSDAVRADLPTTAGLVADAVHATVGAATYDVVGYSLGARLALHVVTGTDLPVGRLVVIGGTGGIEDPDARQKRREADEATAAALEASGDVASFIARWVSSPMFARLADLAQTEERLRNTATGLASSLRLAGAGTQEPLWELVPSLEMPLLAIAGTDDNRFTAHALRLAHAAPSGVVSLIPGGGHAAHLAQPNLVTRTVRHWLATTR